jgi:hypothetical protein
VIVYRHHGIVAYDGSDAIELRPDGYAPVYVGSHDAARLLAGLEVALAAALREAGRGKCLRCGRVEEDICGYDTEQCHCTRCFGALYPLPARGEGE